MLVLIANAIDLTTSFVPSPADHLVPMPARTPWEWMLQLAALVPLAAWLLRRAPQCAGALRQLPLPRAAGFVLGAYFAIACVHVALRMERFPWSPVAMFSSAVPPAAADSFSHTTYALVRGSWVEPISFLLEGNQIFQRFDFGFDYKAGWAMRLYAPTHSSARDLLARLARARDLPEPRRVKLRYLRSTGKVVGLSQLAGAR